MIIKDEVVEYEYEEIFNKWRMFDGTFTVLRDEYGEVLAVCIKAGYGDRHEIYDIFGYYNEELVGMKINFTTQSYSRKSF